MSDDYVGSEQGVVTKMQYNACDDPPSLYFRAFGVGIWSMLESYYGFDPTGKHQYHKVRGHSLNHSFLHNAQKIAEVKTKGKGVKEKQFGEFKGGFHTGVGIVVALYDFYLFGMFLFYAAKSALHKSTSEARRLSPCNRGKKGHIYGALWPNPVPSNEWSQFNVQVSGSKWYGENEPSVLEIEKNEQGSFAISVKVRQELSHEYMPFSIRLLADYGDGKTEVLDAAEAEVELDQETQQAYGAGTVFTSKGGFDTASGCSVIAQVYVASRDSNTIWEVEVLYGYKEAWKVGPNLDKDGGVATVPPLRKKRAKRSLDWLLRNWKRLPKSSKAAFSKSGAKNGWGGWDAWINENHISITTSGSSEELSVVPADVSGAAPLNLTASKIHGGAMCTLIQPVLPIGTSIIEAGFVAVADTDLCEDDGNGTIFSAVAKLPPWTAVVPLSTGKWIVKGYFAYIAADGTTSWSPAAKANIETV